MAEKAPVQTTTALTQRSAAGSSGPKLENLTPSQIVVELDKYIVGQNDAKRAVAVALRNRYRRQLLPEQLRREVQPKNILMIGPTGVGKTEVARRVARIVDAPFIKVKATKFTEVGYVGRDVESIIRDLVEVAISDLHSRRLEQVNDEAANLASQRLVDLITDQTILKRPSRAARRALAEATEQPADELTQRRKARERKRIVRLLAENQLEKRPSKSKSRSLTVRVITDRRTSTMDIQPRTSTIPSRMCSAASSLGARCGGECQCGRRGVS